MFISVLLPALFSQQAMDPTRPDHQVMLLATSAPNCLVSLGRARDACAVLQTAARRRELVAAIGELPVIAAFLARTVRDMPA